MRELTIVYTNIAYDFGLFFNSFNPFEESLCKHLKFFGKARIIYNSYYLKFTYGV